VVTPLVSVRDFGFGYGRRSVGRDVSFDLSPGEVLCLLGPNGGGKTTLFKTMLGLVPRQEGNVRFRGEPIHAWPRARIARAMAYVPQAHVAFFPFTVEEIVLMGRTSRMGLFAAPSGQDYDVARRAMASLGIAALAERVYTELSGGERQLTLIARALAQEPAVLIMDEPTASLDFGNQVKVLERIRQLASSGIAVVLSTHDPDHAFLCADRVAMLHDGRLLAIGAPDDTITPRNLGVVYGVDVEVVTLPGSGRRVCLPSLAGQQSETHP
jgi:iron complex transport system ATP-binding protein